MMYELLAKLLAQPAVADYLIARAQKTPYFHLDGYMHRWWLFNGYGEDKVRPHPWMLVSGRIHLILRKDYDKWPHNHPANCRTFILRGWYKERRDDGVHLRKAGDTVKIDFNDYHSIEEVSPGGVYTLFILGRNRGDWGFRVNGVKVPWRQYQRSRHDSRNNT